MWLTKEGQILLYMNTFLRFRMRTINTHPSNGIPKPQTQTNQTPPHIKLPRTPTPPRHPICLLRNIYNARHLISNTKNLSNLQTTFSIFRAPNTTGSSHVYNTLELLMMAIVVPETCWASNLICNKNQLFHLVYFHTFLFVTWNR
jgi:hypothetical protein